jgi:hypothetical protein
MPDEMKPCAKCNAESRRAATSQDQLCIVCFDRRKDLHPIFQMILAALDLHENFALTNQYFMTFGFKLEDVQSFVAEQGLRMSRFEYSMDIVFSRPHPPIDLQWGIGPSNSHT